jgi:hypothetical protein
MARRMAAVLCEARQNRRQSLGAIAYSPKSPKMIRETNRRYIHQDIKYLNQYVTEFFLFEK